MTIYLLGTINSAIKKIHSISNFITGYVKWILHANNYKKVYLNRFSSQTILRLFDISINREIHVTCI